MAPRIRAPTPSFRTYIQPLIFEGRVQQLPLGLIPGVGGLAELPIEIVDKSFGGCRCRLFVTYRRLQSLYFPFQTAKL